MRQLCVLFLIIFQVSAALTQLKSSYQIQQPKNNKATALAEPPALISRQGYIADSTGASLNGNFPMTFGFFSDSIGGSAVLSESFSAIAFSSGIYSVNLDVSSISFTGQYWLETSINGQTLTPRSLLTSTPYALHADTSDYVLHGTAVETIDRTRIVDSLNRTNDTLTSQLYLRNGLTMTDDGDGVKYEANWGMTTDSGSIGFEAWSFQDPSQFFKGAFCGLTGNNYQGSAFCGTGGITMGVITDAPNRGNKFVILGINSGHTIEYPDFVYLPHTGNFFFNAGAHTGGQRIFTGELVDADPGLGNVVFDVNGTLHYNAFQTNGSLYLYQDSINENGFRPDSAVWLTVLAKGISRSFITQNHSGAIEAGGGLQSDTTFYYRSPQIPASHSSPGAKGQVAWDNSFFYIYTGTIWKRVALADSTF
jgi:hypothetical protein